MVEHSTVSCKTRLFVLCLMNKIANQRYDVCTPLLGEVLSVKAKELMKKACKMGVGPYGSLLGPHP